MAFFCHEYICSNQKWSHMKAMQKILPILTLLVISNQLYAQNPGGFTIDKDLLLAQLDCKTDVDDLHTAAALATLLANERYDEINYHAVAGTYGIQEGLYVPGNELFEMAFDDNWSDAHTDLNKALYEVSAIVKETLKNNGDIWIADAGQSDFSAKLIRMLNNDMPEINTKERIHVVQHSDWNEEVTTPEDLAFVKANSDYHKIPDGNAVGNGTPGFRTPDFTEWKSYLSDPRLTEIWQLAVDIGNRYNGVDGRYLNEAVKAGGLDFSDLSEICWMLGLEDIRDTEEFFERFGE